MSTEARLINVQREERVGGANSRAAPASPDGLPPHVLDILRPLLEHIAAHGRRPADREASDAGTEKTGSEPSYAPGEGQARLDAASQADGEADGADAARRPVPPRLLLIAARVAALLADPETRDALGAPCACVILVLPSATDRCDVNAELQHGETWLPRIPDPLDLGWRRVAFVRLDDDDGRSEIMADRRAFANCLERAVAQGLRVVALMPSADPVSPVLRALCRRTVAFPPLTAELLAEVLRVTHPSPDGALPAAALPPDEDLAILPTAVVEVAFRQDTTAAVAQELARAAGRLRTTPRTTLADIVLADSVADPVRRLVADMAAWRAGTLAWDEVSSSLLLTGPPGNGKTLLASAIAGSVGATLAATSYSACQKHGHQGDMLAALAREVEEAILRRPSVFFLDELDSFTHRHSPDRFSRYIVGVVNGLLEHLSRLNETPGVIVLGATNHPDMIDPAVTRPGRFDLHVEIGAPDHAMIVRILRHAIGETAGAFDLASVADRLLGLSGAQVTALVREARGLARAEGVALAQDHLDAAAGRIAPAPAPEVLRRVAIHEAGHLVVAHCLGLPQPARAVLTARGGFVQLPGRPSEHHGSALDRIAALLGGRAAERVILGEASSGAGVGRQSDLAQATALAARVHYEWGLAGQLAFTPRDGGESAATVREIDAVLQSCQARAEWIVREEKPRVLRIAEALLAARELKAERLAALLAGIPADIAEPKVVKVCDARALREKLQKAFGPGKGVYPPDAA